MLGWFKKKFGNKTEQEVEEITPQEPVATPDEEQQEGPAPVVSDEPAPQAMEEISSEPSETSSSAEDTPLPTEEPPQSEIIEEPPVTEEQEVAADEEELEAAPAPIQTTSSLATDDTAVAPAPEVSEPEPVEAEEEHIAVEESTAETVTAPEDSTPPSEEETVSTVETVATTDEPEPSLPEDESEEASETTLETEQDSKEQDAPAPEAPKRSQEKSKPSFFTRLSAKLAKSKEAFTYQLDTLFLGKKTIDAELLDDLEEILITADLGYAITEDVLDHARRKVKRNELSDPAALKEVLKKKLASYIEEAQEDAELVMPEEGPFIIMVVGVNGVGKTTTIGKVAHKFVQSGQSVLLIAADTFRAAAVSQLQIWGERNGVDVFSQKEGADPSSVAFDGIAEGVKKDYDVVIIDTAGRLHTQANLMEELKKIKRVVGKKHEGAPHEVLLVIDATTGQNGISQAKLFNEAVDITGIALTKLDGTAKGGIVTNISKELQTPIRFIGIGEGIEDLRDFDHREFIDALFDKDK